MYIWKVEPLVDDLKNERVTQREQFKYILTVLVLTTLATDPILYIGSVYSLNDSVATILMVIVSIWGLWLMSKYNSDGKDFILRFCTLGLPLGVRFFVWFIPLVIILARVESYFEIGVSTDEAGNEVYETTLYQSVVIALAIGFYYWRVAVAMSKVSAPSA